VNYYLTNAAAADLREIIKYTLDQWGEEQVILYRDRLETRFALMAKFPELGRTHVELPDHIFYVTEGKHYVFYKVVDDGIEIIRLLHARMEMIRHISKQL